MDDALHYTYVLLGKRDTRVYTGCPDDVQRRLVEHNAGRARATAHRAAVELIDCEACPNRDDAMRRERVLETGNGKRYVSTDLAAFLQGIGWNKLERH
jgi:putative endonuclease